MTEPRPPVLVLDGYWRKSLAVLRGLHRKNWRIWIGEDTETAPALHSSFGNRRFVYPSPQQRPGQFKDWLRRFDDRQEDVLLLPLEDTTLLQTGSVSLSSFRHTHAGPDVFRNANNKGSVLTTSKRNNLFAVPDTARIDHSTDQLEPITGDPAEIISGDWVVKPVSGAGARGIQYGRGAAEFRRVRIRRRHRNVPDLVQRRIRNGTGICLSMVMGQNGEALSGIAHRRIREWPPSGGASTLREPIDVPHLFRPATQLLRQLEWWGPAQVELRTDPRSGTPYMMEVNPRFWGSLKLAIDAGVNLPHVLCSHRIGRPVTRSFVPERSVRSCWFLPGDLLHRLHSPPGNATKDKKQPDAFLEEHVDVPSNPDRSYDLLNADDVLPAVMRVVSLLSWFLHPVYRLWARWEQKHHKPTPKPENTPNLNRRRLPQEEAREDFEEMKTPSTPAEFRR